MLLHWKKTELLRFSCQPGLDFVVGLTFVLIEFIAVLALEVDDQVPVMLYLFIPEVEFPLGSLTAKQNWISASLATEEKQLEHLKNQHSRP